MNLIASVKQYNPAPLHTKWLNSSYMWLDLFLHLRGHYVFLFVPVILDSMFRGIFQQFFLSISWYYTVTVLAYIATRNTQHGVTGNSRTNKYAFDSVIVIDLAQDVEDMSAIL